MTATLLTYSLICPRKAWLHHHGLRMEQESEAVQLGRLLEERHYQRAPKALELEAELPDGTKLRGKVDWANLSGGVLHETKLGRACEEAHVWQVRFYLWLLALCGVKRSDGQAYTGMLNYPKLRKTLAVELRSEHQADLKRRVVHLQAVLSQGSPPDRISKRSFCRKCAFEEMCYG